MNSIFEVSTPPAETDLTTLARVKSELNISGTGSDTILESKIAEASADVEAHTARTFARQGVTETFFGSPGNIDRLLLTQYPVAEIDSVTIDGVEIPEEEYRVEEETGLLYRLDASGYPCVWKWCKEIVVVYTGGYILPDETGRTLPYALEGAVVDLVSSYWSSRGRDATLKSEDIPGVISREFWVGAVGADGELPPSVVSRISPFRRAQV